MNLPTPQTVRERANSDQHRAAHPANSVWVAASAGTGKTTVLTDRFLRLLLAQCPAQHLLCLTFTKAAAAEMANRIAERLALWVTREKGKLAQELAALLGHPASDEERALARSLFARVLDTPGGLRIMTIHAFCQSLLRRFPLEAAVAPHFELLDDRSSAELMAEAQDDMLRAAGAAEGSALARALALVSGRVGEQEFAELLGGLIRCRGRITNLIEANGSIEALIDTIRLRLSLSPTDCEDAFRAAGAAEAATDMPALRRAAAALARGSEKSDRPCGVLIAEWLDGAPQQRAAGLEAYAGAFKKDHYN
jgi:ATP-dependent helicase/nuclease subunit A